MINFNRQTLRDKIYACWIGKNIGGTIGTPYEGKRQVNDIQGFATKSGAPLPNDDLDLQLVWLRAMEERGPDRVDAKVLGEYWIDYITPFWNEYGIGKSNMKAGLVPPISGQYENVWKNSNGAWIRTEVWASLFPGMPEKAIRFAYEDACVDHGMAEGTYAAIFVAAMDSAAFVIDDINALIEIGLSKIPADCRVAKSVKMAVEAFESGKTWLEARNAVTDDSIKDLGWFQAPANVAYAVIGLLYGKGDFKQTLIIATNCGDDTDCTAATAGALLGIMHGTKVIPEDWKAHIGDSIITVSVNNGNIYVPKTCSELTDRVMNLLPVTTRNSEVRISEDRDDFGGITGDAFKGDQFSAALSSRSPYSFTQDFVFARALVEYDHAPDIGPHGMIGIKVTFYNQTPSQKHLYLRWLLPDGWQVEGGKKNLAMYTEAQTTFRIVAGEKVEIQNRLVLEVVGEGRVHTGLIPILLLG